MFVFRFLYVKEQHVKINLFEHAYYKAISSELTIKFGMVRETVSDSCISGESLCCCHGDHLCVKPIRKSKQYLSLYLQYSTLVKVCWCQNMNSILFACLIIHNNNTSPTQELFISLGAPTSLNFIHEFNYLQLVIIEIIKSHIQTSHFIHLFLPVIFYKCTLGRASAFFFFFIKLVYQLLCTR